MVDGGENEDERNNSQLPRLRKLSEMLEESIEDFDEVEIEEDHEAIKEEEDQVLSEDFCVECEVEKSQIFCEQCHDYFCSLCGEGQHRKGNRRQHTFQPVLKSSDETKETAAANCNEDSGDETHDSDDAPPAASSRNICNLMGNLILGGFSGSDSCNGKNSAGSSNHHSVIPRDMLERAKYIPLRLTYEERKLLRTLEASLAVCNYTDKLDNTKFLAPGKRIRMQLQEICGFLSGIVVASDYKVGQVVLDEKNYSDSAGFFQEIFELGRRYKIMNPEKMRGEYGKLMYLLQDALSPEIQELLGFSCHSKIQTVYDVLAECNALHILEDDRIEIATQVVSPLNKSRSQIQKEIDAKNNAVRLICKNYTTAEISGDEIHQCLYSIGDNNYHLYFERDPIDRMIDFLKTYFSPQEVGEHSENCENKRYSLAIVSGNDGARLSHSHLRQFNYVLQSLTLWREIAHDMFRFWYLTDEDLLLINSTGKTNKYSLEDTGQGLHRVQAAPNVSRAMHSLLHMTQRKLDHWVGSSVIHLGDKNVPNALMFIDKYAQVGHILRPIVRTLDEMSRLFQDSKDIRQYIQETYGDIETAKKDILVDFFREAFDGSGADNFFEAGSCIDGRLTSAWNWCSNLHTKKFYPVFKLCGFVGFDGKFG